MRTTWKRNNREKERGIALFMAIFAMMLLSAIGLAMVFAADSETSIDSNFRDQQTATYAALSGLQEGRERMRMNGGSGALTWPTDLPSASAANIIYIINPTTGETVAPWDPTNAYYDWELCTETLASGFCSSGNPPSGNAWYQSFTDSTTAGGGSWHRTVPMNFKWIRINLKANNQIPGVPVVAGTAGEMVCWSGNGQIPKGSGYLNNCSPNGAILSIPVPSGATGYTGTPTITITAPGGTGVQAVATPVMSGPVGGGQITSYTITNAGTGYVTAPTVTVVGDGTGASATSAIVAAGSNGVNSLTLNNNGSPISGCFAANSTQNLVFTPASATGIATMSSQTCMLGWSNTSFSCGSGGSNPYKNANVTIGATVGSGFSATLAFNGSGSLSHGGFVVTNPGTGYTPSSALSITTGGVPCTVTGTPVLGYQVSSVSLTSGGSGYTTAPAVSLPTAPTLGNRPSITATIPAASALAGTVSSVNVGAMGSSYTTATVTLSAPPTGGTQATATANITPSSRAISSITVSTAGSGYTTPPTVTISGGGGPTLTTTANLATAYYGQIAVVTAYGQTQNFGTRAGSKAIMQTEITTQVRYPFQFSIGGAITLPGPTPSFGTPNSNPFYVKGTDADSCGGVSTAKPSIGVYDPNNSSAVTNLIGDLARPDHYPGVQASPDVENVTGMQGATPSALDSFVNTLLSLTPATQQFLSPNPASPTTFAMTSAQISPAAPGITYIDGNADIGPISGSGILIVTGNLYMHGDYSFNGLILVIGQGTATFAGGGNAQINGSLYVAKTKDTSGNELSALGTPTLDYSGGGGNGVQYDHCKADALLGVVPQTAPPTDTTQLTVISQRTVYR